MSKPILFRCSGLGEIMNTKDEIIEGTKTAITKVIAKHLGREDDIYSKYMDKGTTVEEDSITLYSKVSRKMFRKNEERLTNDYISGTPDIYLGESIEKADHVIDIKSSWDLFTFLKAKTQDVKKNYYWQLQGYMALTGAKSATLAYCLVNTPDHLIYDEKRKLAYKMGLIDEMESPVFIEACKQIELNTTFDDIPEKQRVFTYSVERNEADIARLYMQVERCRTYIKENFAELVGINEPELTH